MSLSPTNRHNPCRICENTSGSCRQVEGRQLELFNPTGNRHKPQISSSITGVCPKCGSANISVGSGRKPNQESRRCRDCKHFLGYSPLAKLKKAHRRKELTECLQILENRDIRGDLAIFTLSLAADGGES
jgi:hypothetical protein